ncbi:MAG TPA: Crp/Fnr family transcriptional regulator [Gaiellaceae bacterium]|nr:Crp/Fnr family transcriptional regulator [Gaiellaceae bacterium]
MAAPVELLKRVPLFQGLDEKHLKRVADEFTDRSFVAGQDLTSEGGGGVGFFVIESGEARVTVDGEERRRLGPGDYFGEVALLDAGVRTATVTALEDGKMFGLTPWQFRPLVEENASIAWPLLQAMAKRTRELEQPS